MTESPSTAGDRGSLHQLAYELSLRALTQQESVLNALLWSTASG